MKPVLVAAMAVVIVAIAVAAAVVLLDDDGDDGGSTPSDAVDEFLDAYERSRTETFVVEQRFTRTTPGGQQLSFDRRLVQQPPDDRLVVGGGAAEGRLDGRVVRCSTAPDGTSRCDEGPPAGPYDEEVEAELAELQQLVVGESPVYVVERGEPGCYALRLRVVIPSPPYGELAGFCFDEATGAPTRVEVRREEATDVTEAVDIRTQVTEADLRPGDLGDLPT